MKTFETSGQLRYQDGFKYQVTEDWWIMTGITGYSANFKNRIILDLDGKLTLKDGFGCDGGSGPTIDTDSSMRATFTHDGLYRLFRQGLLPISFRKDADELLRDIGIFDGMWKWRAWGWFLTVKKFAMGSARRQERKEKLAP